MHAVSTGSRQCHEDGDDTNYHGEALAVMIRTQHAFPGGMRLITFSHALRALALVATTALAACNSQEAMTPPALGPDEVLLDKSFNVALFLLPNKISLTILT